MYGCIVAPVDGTSFGEYALPWAVSVAQRSGATLHLAHVHVPLIGPSGVEAVAFRGSWNDVTKEQERGYLEGLGERLASAYRIRVKSALIEGPVASALEHYTLECGATLVVMSTHAHPRIRRLWHHRVAETIARALPMPVLLVHPPRDDEPPEFGREKSIRSILVPLDGSIYAEAMLEHAITFGRPFGARFTLLRVVRPEMAVGYTLLAQDGHVDHHRLHQAETEAHQYLSAIAERLRAIGLEVNTRVIASADAANAIVDFVRAADEPEGPVDAIALETHPHGAVSRVLGAHTADQVLRDSPVPTLLFEPLAKEKSREHLAMSSSHPG